MIKVVLGYCQFINISPTSSFHPSLLFDLFLLYTLFDEVAFIFIKVLSLMCVLFYFVLLRTNLFSLNGVLQPDCNRAAMIAPKGFFFIVRS